MVGEFVGQMVEIAASDLAVLRAAAAHDEQVREMEREVTEAKADWEKAKDRSLAAKKRYDELVNDLRDFIAEAPDPQLNLFDQPVTRAVVANNSDAQDSSPDVDWRDRPIADTGLSDKMLDKLREIGIHNLGQAETFRVGQVAGYPGGARDIAGWGAKKVSDFENALLGLMPADASDLAPETGPDEVDLVEDDPAKPEVSQSEIDTVVEPEIEAEEKVRIRIKANVPGMEPFGFITGAEFDAELDATGMAIVVVDGENMVLQDNEYETVTAADEPSELAETA